MSDNQNGYLNSLVDMFNQANYEANIKPREQYLEQEYQRRQQLAELANNSNINPYEEVNQKKKQLQDSFNRGEMNQYEVYQAISTDPVLNSMFPNDNAKDSLFKEIIGYAAHEGTASFDEIYNKQLAEEDDEDRNALSRIAYGTGRQLDQWVRRAGSGINNVLGAMGLTEGSYDHKIKENLETMSRMPMQDIQNIDRKLELYGSLKDRLQDIDKQVINASSMQEANALLQEKANIQKLLERSILTPEEEELFNSGTYGSYKRLEAEIDSLKADKARWEGGSIFSDVNDVDSYKAWQDSERARRLDDEYRRAGIDPSWLNFNYAVDSLKLAADKGLGGYTRALADIIPYMAMAFTTGGTATAAKLLQMGATYTLAASDAYTRYTQYVAEQIAKDPNNVDKVRAAEGAIAGVVADFFGSKLAVGVPKGAYSKVMNKIRGINETMAKEAKYLARTGANSETIQKMAAVAGKAEAETNGMISALSKDIANIPVQQTGVVNAVKNLARGTAELPAKAIKAEKSLHKVGLAPVQDFGKAGAFLGIENTGSAIAKQYGEGTDLDKLDWNEIADSAAEGLIVGAAFHAPGMGIHAAGAGVNKLISMYKGDKAKYVPQSNSQMNEIERMYAKGRLNDEQLSILTNSVEDSIEKLGKLKDEYKEKIKPLEDQGLVTFDKEGKAVTVDGKSLSMNQRLLLRKFNNNYSSFDKLIDQHKENLKRLSSIKEVKEASKGMDIVKNQKEKTLDIENVEAVNAAVKRNPEAVSEALKDTFTEEEIKNITEQAQSVVDGTEINIASKIADPEIENFISTDLGKNVQLFQGLETKENENIRTAIKEVIKARNTGADDLEAKVTALQTALEAKSTDAQTNNKRKLWSKILNEVDLVNGLNIKREDFTNATIEDIAKDLSASKATVGNTEYNKDSDLEDIKKAYANATDKEKEALAKVVGESLISKDKNKVSTLDQVSLGSAINKELGITDEQGKVVGLKAADSLLKDIAELKGNYDESSSARLYKDKSTVENYIAKHELKGVEAKSTTRNGKTYYYVGATDLKNTYSELRDALTEYSKKTTHTKEDKDKVNALIDEVNKDRKNFISSNIRRAFNNDRLSKESIDKIISLVNRASLLTELSDRQDTALKMKDAANKGDLVGTHYYSYDSVVAAKKESVNAKKSQKTREREISDRAKLSGVAWMNKIKDVEAFNNVFFNTFNTLGFARDEGDNVEKSLIDFIANRLNQNIDDIKNVKVDESKAHIKNFLSNKIFNVQASVANINRLIERLDFIKSQFSAEELDSTGLNQKRIILTQFAKFLQDSTVVKDATDGTTILSSNITEHGELLSNAEITRLNENLPKLSRMLAKLGYSGIEAENYKDIAKTDFGTYEMSKFLDNEQYMNDLLDALTKGSNFYNGAIASWDISDNLYKFLLSTKKDGTDSKKYIQSVLEQVRGANSGIKALLKDIDFNSLTKDDLKSRFDKLSDTNKALVIHSLLASKDVLQHLLGVDPKTVGTVAFSTIENRLDNLTTNIFGKSNYANNKGNAYLTAKHAIRLNLISNLVEQGILGAEEAKAVSDVDKYHLMSRKDYTWGQHDSTAPKGIVEAMEALYNANKKDPTEKEIKSIGNLKASNDIALVQLNYKAYRYNQALEAIQTAYDTGTPKKSELTKLTDNLNEASADLDTSIASYTERDPAKVEEKDSYDHDDIVRFLNILKDNKSQNYTVEDFTTVNKDAKDKNVSPELSENLKDTFENLINSVNNGELFTSNNTQSFDTKDLNKLGNLLAKYIDNKQLNNKISTVSNKKGNKVATAPNTKHLRLGISTTTGEDTITLKKGKTTIFAYIDGMTKIRNSNASFSEVGALNDVLKRIENLANKLTFNVKVNPNRLVDRLFTTSIGGVNLLNKNFTSVVAAVAMNEVITLSEPDTTKDFLDKLAAWGASQATIDYYAQNHIADISTMQTQLGTSVMMALGVDTNKLDGVQKVELTEELGVLALTALDQLGVVDLIHIAKEAKNGKVETKRFVSGGLANSLKGVKFNSTEAGKLKDILSKLDYQDNNKTKNLLTETLGTRPNRYERGMKESEYKDYQDNLENDYNENGERGRVTYSEESDDKKQGYISINLDNHVAKVCVKSDEGKNKPEYVYLDAEQIWKTDNTLYTPSRMLEIATKQHTPKEVIKEYANQQFELVKDMSEDEIRQINDWDSNLTKEKEAIRSLIDYDDKIQTGVKESIRRNKNISQAVKFLKNAKYYYELQKEAKGNSIKLYFKEINSVNNRSSVRGTEMNYREDNLNRSLYEYTGRTITVEKEDLPVATLLAKSAILANIGLDVDKDTKQQIEDKWNNIKGSLPALVQSFDGTNTLSNRLDAIKTFNEATGSEVKYTVTTLSTLKNLNELGISDYTDFEWDNSWGDKWHIRMEVDGQTNGPAIKIAKSGDLDANTTLTEALRIAAGIFHKDDFKNASMYGAFAEIRGDAYDTYELNGVYALDEALNHTADVLYNSLNNSTAYNFLKYTYSKTKGLKKTNLEELTLKDLIRGILSRDMMKSPTMVTNYGAGYKAMINKLLDYTTTEVSGILGSLAYAKNTTEFTDNLQLFRSWIQEATKLNGGKVMFTSTTGDRIAIDSNLHIYQNGVDIGELDLKHSDILKTLDLDLNSNKALIDQVTKDFINPVWDGICKALEPIKKQDMMYARVAECHANAINFVLMDQVKKLMETYKDGNIPSQVLDETIKQVDHYIDSTLVLGESSDTLKMVRDSKTEFLTNTLKTILEFRDGSFIYKEDVNIALKESISSALAPEVTHTSDSGIMHRVQANIRSIVGEVLGVHDAIEGRPDQLAKGGKELNKQYFIEGMTSYKSLAYRNDLLRKAIDNLNAVYGNNVPTDLRSEMIRTLNDAERELRILKGNKLDTLNRLLAQMDAKLNKGEQPKDTDKADDMYVQYAFLNITGYTPTRDVVKDLIKGLADDNTFSGSITKAITLLEENYSKFQADKTFFKKFFGDMKNQDNTAEFKGSKDLKDYRDLKTFIDKLKSETSDQGIQKTLDDIYQDAMTKTCSAFKEMYAVTQSTSTTNNVAFLNKESSVSMDSYSHVYESLRTSTNKFFTDNTYTREAYENAIKKMTGVLGAYGPTPLTKLMLMVSACSDRVSPYELNQFFNIFNKFEGNVLTTLDLTDEVRGDDVHISFSGDDVNYNDIANHITERKNQLDREGYTSNLKTTNDQLAANEWFVNNVLNEVNAKYKNLGSNSTLVLTMNNLSDITELMGIAYAQSTGTLQKFNVCIQPAITNLKGDGVNKDVQIAHTLRTNYPNATIHTNLVSNSYKNVGPLEVFLGHKFNRAYVEQGITTGNENYTYKNDDGTNKVQLSTGAMTNINIYKKNEFGDRYETAYSTREIPLTYADFNSLDLSTKPIRDLGKKDVAIQRIDPENIDVYADTYINKVSENVERIGYPEEIDLLDGNIDSILKDNNVLVFDMFSDGKNFISTKQEQLIKHPKIRALYNDYQRQYNLRYSEYLAGKMSWEDFLRPIYATTDKFADGNLRAIFTVGIDNSTTAKSIGDVVTYNVAASNTRMRNAQGLNLSNSVASLLDPNKIDKIASFTKGAYNSLSDKRLFISKELLSPTVLNTDPDRTSDRSIINLHYINSIVNEVGASNVITFNHTDANNASVDSKGYLTDVYTYNFSGAKSVQIPLGTVSNKAVATVVEEHTKNRRGVIQAAKDTLVGLMKGYNTQSLNKIHKYDISNIASKHDIQEHINLLSRDDNARGIDNSHLESLIPMIEEMSMKVNLVFNRSMGKAGSEAIIYDTKKQEKAVYITHGLASGTTSNLELFMHETVHGIFEHLHLDPSAQRMASQLLAYAKANLKAEHFSDLTKEEANEMLDYIFNKSNDHLAEFLAYAMTNKAFQNALQNMGIDKNLAGEFFTKLKGISSRFTNSLGSKMDANEVPTDVMSAVKQIFNITYQNSNKVWDSIREKDGLTTGERFDLIFNRTPLYKTLMKSINMISQYKPEFDIMTSKIGNPTNNLTTMLTDIVRDLWGNHSEFIKELATSLESASPRNFDYIELRQIAKQAIDVERTEMANAVNSSVREILKDVEPKIMNKLTDYVVKADISCLFDNSTNVSNVIDLIRNPEARTKEIAKLESSLRKNKFGKYYINASKGLSEYMRTGINPTGLGYRNAYEIASIAGSKHWYRTNLNNTLVTEIDKLVTLYNIDALDKADGEIYKALSDDALIQLADLHNGTKRIELNLLKDTEQRLHIPKGDLHGGNGRGSYRVYPEASRRAVEWTMPSAVTSTRLDPFYKGLVGEDKYITVHHALRSSVPVDAGIYAMTDMNKGRVAGGVRLSNERRADVPTTDNEVPKIVDYLNARVANLNSDNPTLINPDTVDGGIVLSFGPNGNLIGSNFELNPIVTNKKIGRNVKITSVLGDLAGSTIERGRAPDTNLKVAEVAYNIYEQKKNSEKFFWVSENSENQKERDMYDSMPYEVKEFFREKFGDQGIPVPESAATIVLGKRTPTSKKMDDEYYQLLDQAQVKLKDYMTHLFHHGLVNKAEDLFAYLTKIGKENLAIRGLSVSFNNILSNTLTLQRHGLTPSDSIKLQLEGIDQVRQLESYQEKINAYKAKRLSGKATNQDVKNMRALYEGMKSLPIYPLYAEGVLGTITEDLSETDHIIKDTIDNYLPSWVATVAHNVVGDEKSVFFNKAKDFADIGDKAGKYALFRALPDTMPLKEKKRQLTTTFIDYGIPLPTGFDVMERIGLQNFLKYPLGIQTELLESLMRNPDNTLRSLMVQAGLGFQMPDAYSSLLGINNVERGLNAPGLGIYTDSISALPTVRIANEITEMF